MGVLHHVAKERFTVPRKLAVRTHSRLPCWEMLTQVFSFAVGVDVQKAFFFYLNHESQLLAPSSFHIYSIFFLKI